MHIMQKIYIVIPRQFIPDKELNAAKERQDIELAAQRATLQEQRKHIGILDKALQNAQHNTRCLEDEVGGNSGGRVR